MLNVGFFVFKKEEGRERKMESQTGCILELLGHFCEKDISNWVCTGWYAAKSV